jgi:hypothetical protein
MLHDSMNKQLPPILQVGDILISSDILTEPFCCDLSACKGQCCIEGDAGAPVMTDEVMEMENMLDAVWGSLSASAQAVIDKQGVAYIDEEGDLVTSIVNGKDCVFTCYDDIQVDGKPIRNCCLCALEMASKKHANASQFIKPISCALYPIREKRFSSGLIGLNYHRWSVCECARKKGKSLDLPIYRFLKEPLIRRFGKEWYAELETIVKELAAQGFEL